MIMYLYFVIVFFLIFVWSQWSTIRKKITWMLTEMILESLNDEQVSTKLAEIVTNTFNEVQWKELILTGITESTDGDRIKEEFGDKVHTTVKDVVKNIDMRRAIGYGQSLFS